MRSFYLSKETIYVKRRVKFAFMQYFDNSITCASVVFSFVKSSGDGTTDNREPRLTLWELGPRVDLRIPVST